MADSGGKNPTFDMDNAGADDPPKEVMKDLGEARHNPDLEGLDHADESSDNCGYDSPCEEAGANNHKSRTGINQDDYEDATEEDDDDDDRATSPRRQGNKKHRIGKYGLKVKIPKKFSQSKNPNYQSAFKQKQIMQQ
jgi:hypothetical protein